MGQSNSLSYTPIDMKCFALISLVGVALCAPAPEDAAAPVVLPYGYGLGAYPYALPYAGLPLAYNALHTGLVYPVAEPYVHDASGDARKKREADAQVLLGGAYPYAYGYAGLPYALPVVAPFVAHPNGAIVPLEPADVVKARADHLAAVAEALTA